ncbi:MAG TPA: glutamate racemase [Candidatus Limnocylindria bacterium]|nr:glutamate racemase [Candidatus Limnocylindria bacterium]
MTRSSDSRPIGVFDSGVGGLTVLSELRRRLPDEATVYLGDNERTPYGPRPADEVRRFTLECVAWLLRQDVKALVLACNTATSHALADVRDVSPVPVLGVVRPGAVTAAAATRSGHVGVIATAGTVASGAYPAALNEADRGLVVRQQACPDLVPLVEAGRLEGPEAAATVDGYLDQLLAADAAIDTLLLGCTHYPLLRPLIEARVGPGVAVVDSAFTTALATEDLLDALGSRAASAPPGSPPAGAGPGGHRIATTGDVAAFSAVAERVFGARLPQVEAAEVGAH